MDTPTSESVTATMDTMADRARGTVDRAAQTAHETIDRLAAKAGPAVERLRSSTTSTAESLRARADAFSQWEEEWLQNARNYVRENPLTAVGIGVLAGMILAKLASSSSSR